jgi:hypothetical protein
MSGGDKIKFVVIEIITDFNKHLTPSQFGVRASTRVHVDTYPSASYRVQKFYIPSDLSIIVLVVFIIIVLVVCSTI